MEVKDRNHASLLIKAANDADPVNQAIRDLQTAMDHHLYTSDMFHHQTRAVPFVRKSMKDPNFGEPPALPENPRKTSQVFEYDDDKNAHQAQMWSTHILGWPARSLRASATASGKESYLRVASMMCWV